MHAQNGARLTVFAAAPVTMFAGELLDGTTCAACKDIDGKEYVSATDAEQDYFGGYKNCQGGSRCRGTIVALVDCL